MSLKSFVSSRIAQRITGPARLERARARAEAKRQREGALHTISYFHQADDPYSHLMAQLLPALIARYDVRIAFHLVSPPPDWAAPDRERLIAYSRTDAERLATKSGLTFTDPGEQPPDAEIEHAESALAALVDGGQAVSRAAEVSAGLWRGEAPTTPSADPIRVKAIKAEGDALRAKEGHYLGAMLHYGGEWYWGIDRLHFLEARLRAVGAAKDGEAPLLYPQPELMTSPSAGPVPEGTDIYAYLSFRSPYSYLAAGRLKALSDHYGATLRPRFVLPMVMRGLEVPRPKGRYIVSDVAREARRLGMPFGKIADPVGRPVERGYALMPYALSEGLAIDYCVSFLQGVWSEGIDAGEDAGLRRIAERAGLDWRVARDELKSEAWRAIEADNQAELLELGIWGVPSARIGDVSVWGQDRLWVIEDRLKSLVQREEAPAHAATL